MRIRRKKTELPPEPPAPSASDIVARLRSMADPAAVKGMARYGIRPAHPLGVRIPDLRRMAREIGPDHSLALELWDSGIHEARILAAMVDVPGSVTNSQMENWALDFDSWDLCDQVCGNLFSKTPFALRKVYEWCQRCEVFVKRAGFVLIADLAAHDDALDNGAFRAFLTVIAREAADSRNYVAKAVNWALRQVGKRNLTLNKSAIRAAKRIQALDTKVARWIAADALRELTSNAVQDRLHRR